MDFILNSCSLFGYLILSAPLVLLWLSPQKEYNKRTSQRNRCHYSSHLRNIFCDFQWHEIVVFVFLKVVWINNKTGEQIPSQSPDAIATQYESTGFAFVLREPQPAQSQGINKARHKSQGYSNCVNSSEHIKVLNKGTQKKSKTDDKGTYKNEKLQVEPNQ